MTNTATLLHIAGLYLDLYSRPRDLTRPLTPEQVRDAARYFADLLAAYEADLTMAKEKAQSSILPEPDYRELVDQFVDRFEREEGITDGLTEWEFGTFEDLVETFFGYILATEETWSQ